MMKQTLLVDLILTVRVAPIGYIAALSAGLVPKLLISMNNLYKHVNIRPEFKNTRICTLIYVLHKMQQQTP